MENPNEVKVRTLPPSHLDFQLCKMRIQFPEEMLSCSTKKPSTLEPYIFRTSYWADLALRQKSHNLVEFPALP